MYSMRRVLFFLFFIGAIGANGQVDSVESSSWIKEHLELNGYVKYLASASFTDGDNLTTDNLIHNRLNFKYYVSPSITTFIEARNRIFYGETVKLNPFLIDQLENDPGLVDLSKVWVGENAFVLHSNIDRAFVRYSKGKWDISIGRQRINWGVNLAWNPNDLFNAYNLVDFDYQERPGSDALRVQHYFKNSSIEVALRPDSSLNASVGGLMFKFNKFNYDFQLLAANYYSDYALGLGWAGNLKNAGFKGEATYFHPKALASDTSGIVSASLTFDYVFDHGIYVNISGLYNSSQTGSSTLQFGGDALGMAPLSAKNLMPAQFTSFIQASGAFTPALSASLAAFHLHEVDITFYMPSLAYSINNSWDVDLIGQVYFGDYEGQYQNLGNSIFLRLRLSY